MLVAFKALHFLLTCIDVCYFWRCLGAPSPQQESIGYRHVGISMEACVKWVHAVPHAIILLDLIERLPVQ